MAELNWRTPVPVPGPEETEFVKDLVRWLRDQERVSDYDLEAIIAFGGLGVAERMFGFEGNDTGYTPPVDHTVVAAPTAPQKKIVMIAHLHIDGSPGLLELIKKKASAESKVADVNTTSHNHEDIPGPIVLDAADESLIVRIVSGTSDISWSGSYVLVD